MTRSVGTSPAAEFQRTVRDNVKITGVGLHTGASCEITIRPAECDAGIVFVRNGISIPALVGNVTDTARGTTLGADGERVMTVEHLMAALRGCGIDNAVVEMSGPEVPAVDGSALPFVEALLAVGVEVQDRPRRFIQQTEPLWVAANDGFILAVPSEELSITYVMRYAHPMIGARTVSFVFDEEEFRRAIAPARTFVLYEEVAELLARRLAQGGSLENTVVIWQDHLSCDLRFPDEFARHKILDVLGDLALVGAPIRAEIIAVKSGHALNVALAQKIRNEV